jgi:lysine biosynthesis protein LysW
VGTDRCAIFPAHCIQSNGKVAQPEASQTQELAEFSGKGGKPMAVATCVECDEELAISGRPRLGTKLVCGHCGARLEVVSLEPVEVDWSYEDDEDDEWDDEVGYGKVLDDEFADDLDDDLSSDDDDLDDLDDDDTDWR